jgi:hypothetical protein
VSSAKASTDLDPVLAGLATDIEAAKVNLAAAVERQRDLSIDPATASDAALRAERLLETLKARHQEVARYRDEMATAERRAAFEASVTAIHEQVRSSTKARSAKIHRLMIELVAEVAGYQGDMDALDDINAQARQRDRADLVLRKSSVRVENATAWGADAKTPERLQAPLTKGAKEDAEYFTVRRGNQQAAAAWHAHAHDPFRFEGQRLIKSVTRTFIDVDDLRQNLARRQIEASQDDRVRPVTPPRWVDQLDDGGESMVGVRGGRAER